jgi:DNA-binding LacI/PurR family transcriptional regulator
VYTPVDTPVDETVQALRAKGFSVVEAARSDGNYQHFLIGPYTDEQAFGQAKATLEATGYKPVAFIAH